MMTKLVLLTLGLFCLLTIVHGQRRHCYDCNFRWPVCQSMEESKRSWVARPVCRGRCFIRKDTNGLIYRGCAAYFPYMAANNGPDGFYDPTRAETVTTERYYLCSDELCNYVPWEDNTADSINAVASVQIKAGTRTTTSMTAIWPAVSGATCYTVTISPNEGTMQKDECLSLEAAFTGLTPGTLYRITVVAQKDDLNSDPTSTDEATFPEPPGGSDGAVSGLGAVTIVPGSITTTSMGVTWTAAPNGVFGYFLTVSPTGGNDDHDGGLATSASLTNLAPNTEYTITVVTRAHGLTSEGRTTAGTTLPGPGSVVSISVRAGSRTTTSMIAEWPAVPGATGYTVSVAPGGGTSSHDGGPATETSLTNLTPGTLYTIIVVARRNAEVSGPASTSEPTFPEAVGTSTGSTSANAITVVPGTIDTTSFDVTWTPSIGAVRGYTLTISPVGGTVVYSGGLSTQASLAGLDPATTYTVTVVATNYGLTSDTRSTDGTTLAIPDALGSVVSISVRAGSRTTTSMIAEWPLVPSATGYTVSVAPGGGTSSHDGGPATETFLTNLTPGTLYTIIVVARRNAEVSNPASTSEPTFPEAVGTSTGSTSANAIAVVPETINVTSFDVTWSPSIGAVSGYTLTLSPGGGTVVYSGGLSTEATLVGLDPATTYTITVVATNHGLTSDTRSTDGTTLNTEYCLVDRSDLVFVIDASGSVGTENFQKQLDFVQSLVDSVNVGDNNVRVGALSFSSGAVVQFQLNEFNTALAVENAIAAIPYMAQSTDTVAGLQTMRLMFSTQNGARLDVPDVAIVITDGRSKDGDPAPVAQAARDDGISIFVVGINTSELDEFQIRDIASDPDETFALIVDDFDVLDQVLATLTATCFEPPIIVDGLAADAGTAPPIVSIGIVKEPVQTLDGEIVALDDMWPVEEQAVATQAQACSKMVSYPLSSYPGGISVGTMTAASCSDYCLQAQDCQAVDYYKGHCYRHSINYARNPSRLTNRYEKEDC